MTLRLKLERSALKLRVLPRFPSSVTVQSPILLDTTGGIYDFSIDIDALTDSLDPFYAPISLLAEPVIVTAGSAIVAADTAAIAVQRVAPSATGLTLPSVAARGGLPLHIFDWSTSVTDHAITLTPSGAETIMQAASFPINSTLSTQGIGVTLYPSVLLNGWYIAP